MNQFVNAVTSIPVPDRTDNGMATFNSSMSANVDLFFKIGSARNADVSNLLAKAIGENDDLAIRNILWARDIRGGAGERNTPRKLISWLVNHGHLAEVKQILPLIPELGRWDDLFVLENTPLENDAFALYEVALREGNGLAAKWAPRKGGTAAKFRKFMGMQPKQYRKMIVGLSNTVEQKMCAKEWDSIDFGKLPSVASARYQTAFHRNAKENYEKYKAALVKGEAKVNASALFPHDIVRSMKASTVNDAVSQAQWDALPDLTAGRKILAMCDTSGSMTCTIGGSVQAIDVSLALGMYLANKNVGAFHNIYLEFSSRAKIVHLKGESIRGFMNQFKSIVESTNIIAGFEEILRVAKAGKVLQEDMPEYLVILSDMEFDYCAKYDDTAMQAITRRFTDAGYEVPKIVFWNLAANRASGNVHVKFNDKGVCLVSGFSPAILKSVLNGEAITPESIMLDAIGSSRYNWKSV